MKWIIWMVICWGLVACRHEPSPATAVAGLTAVPAPTFNWEAYNEILQTSMAPFPPHCENTNHTYYLTRETPTDFNTLATAVNPQKTWTAVAGNIYGQLPTLTLTNQLTGTEVVFQLGDIHEIKHLTWAHNGQAVALVHVIYEGVRLEPPERVYVLSVYEVAGVAHEEIGRYAAAPSGEMPFAWSPDSRALYFAARPAADAFYRLVAYHLDGRSMQEMLTARADHQPPLFAFSGEWVALAAPSYLAIADTVSWQAKPYPVSTPPLWPMFWLGDHRHLLFIQPADGGYNVVVQEAASGLTRHIAAGLKEIAHWQYDPHAGMVTFWADGFEWGYFADGTLAFQVPVPDSRQNGRFWSPDHSLMLLKRGPRGDEALILVYLDGRAPVTIRDHLAGLGDPFWAPDSQVFALSQMEQDAPPGEFPSLDIVGIDGTMRWRQRPFFPYTTLIWLSCE